MKRRAILSSTLIALLLTALPAWARGSDEDALRVEGLRALYEDGKIRVEFAVEGVFDAERLEQIHSGIPVKFSHRIDVIAARKYMLSPRRVLARTVIETRVAYDTLTKNYELSRVTQTHKPVNEGESAALRQHISTNDVDEMRRFMTRFADLLLQDPAGADAALPLSIQVESSLDRRFVLLMFPARKSVKATAKVTN